MKVRIPVHTKAEKGIEIAKLQATGVVRYEEHIEPVVVGFTEVVTVEDEEGNVSVVTPSVPIYEKKEYLVYDNGVKDLILSVETLDSRLKTLESKVSMLEVKE